MKRDFDLVRTILLAIEASDEGVLTLMPAIEGYSYTEIGYHAHIMDQAGLITAVDCGTLSGAPCAMPNSLTWAGHDFLDSIKDDTFWNKAKSAVLKPLSGAAFDVLVSWIKTESARQLGIS